MENTKVVTVAGALDIVRSAGILPALQEALAPHCSVRLDLSAVTRIDVAGLQLICSAHRTAQAVGAGFSLSPLPSPALVATAREAGFQRHAACVGEMECVCLWSDDPGGPPQGEAS